MSRSQMKKQELSEVDSGNLSKKEFKGLKNTGEEERMSRA